MMHKPKRTLPAASMLSLLWICFVYSRPSNAVRNNDGNLRHMAGLDASIDSWSVLADGASGQPVIVQGYSGAHRISSYTADALTALIGSSDNSADDWVLATMLNRHYATKHNYSYALFSYFDGGPKHNYGALQAGACIHPTRGKMTSHWCKVLAIQTAMDHFKESDVFVYLDTDVTIRDMTSTFTTYAQDAATCDGSAATNAAVLFSWNNAADEAPRWPGCHGEKPFANSGAILMKRSQRLSTLLAMWWAHAGANQGYDQNVFNQVREKFPDDFAVFSDKIFTITSPGQFLVHRCGGCSWMPSRPSIVKTVMQENALEIGVLAQGLSRAKRSLFRLH